jgi:hypothetical protein
MCENFKIQITKKEMKFDTTAKTGRGRGGLEFFSFILETRANKWAIWSPLLTHSTTPPPLDDNSAANPTHRRRRRGK